MTEEQLDKLVIFLSTFGEISVYGKTYCLPITEDNAREFVEDIRDVIQKADQSGCEEGYEDGLQQGAEDGYSEGFQDARDEFDD